jgi:uncharacterized protein YukE
MSQFTGMDIQAVRQLSSQLKAKADDIRSIMQQLGSQLQNTPWVGPDRERFLGEWQSNHVSALNNVINGLEAASNAATQNAAQQESASNG